MNNLIHRPRRLRRTAALRAMVRETKLDAADFIYPLFVCAGGSAGNEKSNTTKIRCPAVAMA